MITVFGLWNIDYRLWRLWSMDYHKHEDDIMDGIMLNNTKYQLFKKSLIGKTLKNKEPIQRSTRIKNITVLLHTM